MTIFCKCVLIIVGKGQLTSCKLALASTGNGKQVQSEQIPSKAMISGRSRVYVNVDCRLLTGGHSAMSVTLGEAQNQAWCFACRLGCRTRLQIGLRKTQSGTKLLQTLYEEIDYREILS